MSSLRAPVRDWTVGLRLGGTMHSRDEQPHLHFEQVVGQAAPDVRAVLLLANDALVPAPNYLGYGDICRRLHRLFLRKWYMV